MALLFIHDFDLCPARNDPALVLSSPCPVQHGRSGVERSGLALSLDAEKERREAVREGEFGVGGELSCQLYFSSCGILYGSWRGLFILSGCFSLYACVRADRADLAAD